MIKNLIKQPDKYIFPEVSFITYDRGVHYIPFIGIAFIPEKIIKDKKSIDFLDINLILKAKINK